MKVCTPTVKNKSLPTASHGKNIGFFSFTKCAIKLLVFALLVGCSTPLGKGPRPVLWAGSRTACVKITINSVQHLQKYCAIFVIIIIIIIYLSWSLATCWPVPVSPATEEVPSLNMPVRRLKVAILLLDLTTGKSHGKKAIFVYVQSL